MMFSNGMTLSKKALAVFLCAVSLGACKEKGDPEIKSAEAQRDRYGVLNATFFVDKMSATTTETLGYNSWGFPNEKQFNFRACFKDQLLRGALQNWDVVIQDGSSQKSVQTDFGGCANWSETYSFDYFAPESYIEVRRIFKVTGGHRGDVEVVLGVNPWSGRVVDLRYDEIQDVTPNASGPTTFTATLSSTAVTKAETDQKSITLKYQGHAYNDFEVDHNLNLKVAHYYQIEFRPAIFRRTLAQAKAAASPNQGQVRLKAVLLRDDINNQDLSSFDNYITAFERVFTIDNGSVKAQTILKFPDITAISSRMKVLVRVEPIVDSPSVTGANFEGYLGSLPGGSMDLVPTEYDVSRIYGEFTTKERQIDHEGLSGLEILKATGRFRELTTADLLRVQSPNDCYYNESLEDRDCRFVLFARATCEALGGKDKGTCVFGSALTLSEIGAFHEGWFAQNNTPISLRREGITLAPETLSFTAGIARARSTSQAFSGSASASLGLGLDMGLSVPLASGGSAGPAKFSGPNLGASFGAKLGGSQSYSYARSVGRSASVQSSQSFSLTSHAQQFEVKAQAKHCMFFIPQDEKRAQTYGLTMGGAYYCDDQAKNVTGLETYYYVSGGGVPTNAWTDGSSLSENPWLMFVRGTGRMGVFRELVSKKQVNIELNDIVIKRDESRIPQALYERVNQDFPGMISEVVSIEE